MNSARRARGSQSRPWWFPQQEGPPLPVCFVSSTTNRIPLAEHHTWLVRRTQHQLLVESNVSSVGPNGGMSGLAFSPGNDAVSLAAFGGYLKTWDCFSFQSSSQKFETEKNKVETQLENKKLELSQKLEELTATQQNLTQLQGDLQKVSVCMCVSFCSLLTMRQRSAHCT